MVTAMISALSMPGAGQALRTIAGDVGEGVGGLRYGGILQDRTQKYPTPCTAWPHRN